MFLLFYNSLIIRKHLFLHFSKKNYYIYRRYSHYASRFQSTQENININIQGSQLTLSENVQDNYDDNMDFQYDDDNRLSKNDNKEIENHCQKIKMKKYQKVKMKKC